MLKLAGEFEVGREKIELLTYNPGLPNTGDLEVATKTIAATAEASGLVNADYNKALTLPKPADARFIVNRLCARLSVNIAGLGTASSVSCRVYVDSQDADHRLFDLNWTSIGAKLSAADIYSGALATIFNALKDGAAHTFYFFFWANVANQATIDVVQLWEAVGIAGLGAWVSGIMELTHTGLAMWMGFLTLLGTGAQYTKFSIKNPIVHTAATYLRWAAQSYQAESGTSAPFICPGAANLDMLGTVATDLLYVQEMSAVLRSEK